MLCTHVQAFLLTRPFSKSWELRNSAKRNGEKWQMYQICSPASWNSTQFKSECTLFYPDNQKTEYKT